MRATVLLGRQQNRSDFEKNRFPDPVILTRAKRKPKSSRDHELRSLRSESAYYLTDGYNPDYAEGDGGPRPRVFMGERAVEGFGKDNSRLKVGDRVVALPPIAVRRCETFFCKEQPVVAVRTKLDRRMR